MNYLRECLKHSCKGSISVVYFRQGKITICLFCEIEHCKWQPKDKSLKDHMRGNPSSDFIINNDTYLTYWRNENELFTK